MSRRFMDMNAEQELAKYLDYAFYKPLTERFDSLSWERKNDKESQLKGVDGIIHSDKGDFFIDEKATLYYINRNIPTFAFEINSYQRVGLVEGWLHNEDYLTTHYLLVWPNASTSNLAGIQYSDFCNTLCYIVPRQAIIDYLDSMGFTKERLLQDGEIIRQNKKYGKIPIEGTNEIYYYLSAPSDYSESPLNIIIRRNKLQELSTLAITTK